MTQRTHASGKENTYAQHGEDAEIARIFECIGLENRWCVELGALNGTHDSNTRRLITQEKWSAVLIEADPTYYEKLAALYAGEPRVTTMNEFVTFEGRCSLDALFKNTALPANFDLFSLDVDGNEYHLWKSLAAYRPRLLVVEFNPTIPNDVSFVQPRDMSVFQGSSLRSLVELGKQKGYELAATNETNAFFVRAELFPALHISDNSIDALRTDHRFETKLFQLYDGTLKLSGNTTLLWHKLPIDERRIQVLPKHKRRYPARISGNAAIRRLKKIARTLPMYSFVQKLRSFFK